MPIPNMVDDEYGEQRNIATFFPPPPTWVDQISLDGTNNSAYTVPAGATYVIISPSSRDYPYYLRIDAAAVIPAAGKTDGTGSFANLSQCNVRGATTLNFISSSSMYITLAAYK